MKIQLHATIQQNKKITGHLKNAIRIDNEACDKARAEGYTAGHAAGYGKGQADGIEQGKQAEYDRFWDAYQQSGNRTDFQYAYGGIGWTDETYKPKYIDRPVIGEGMFYKSSVTALAVDTSQCTSLGYFLRNNTAIKAIALIDAQKAGDLYWTFGGCTSLESLGIILAESNMYTNAFYNLPALKHMTVEGTIAKSINFQWSNLLTNASVQSVIDHLKDLTGAATQTLTLHADVKAKITDAQKSSITAKNWTLT